MNNLSVLCEQNVNLSTPRLRVLRFCVCKYYYVRQPAFYSPFLFSALCFTSTRMAKAIATAAMAIEV